MVKEPTVQRRQQVFLVSGIVVIFLLIIGCREQPPDEDRVVDEATVVAVATAVPIPTETAPEATAVPESNTEISTNPQDPANDTAVAAVDFAAASLEHWPASIALVGDVQVVNVEETAVTHSTALDIPADADATLLDLYGWDGTSWVFVPSTYEATTQQRQASNAADFQAFALGQAEPSATFTMSGVWREQSETQTTQNPFTETTVATLHLDANAELDGSPTDIPPGVTNPYLQLTNVSEDGEAEPLATLLADESAQMAHVEAITALTEPYAGINLNYQGVTADQQGAFTTFVQNLSEALAAQGKNLFLTLPTPQALDEASHDDGYDWIALGNLADTIYLQLPFDPHAYAEGGAADQLLTWATDHIARHKLVALIPTGPVVGSGETWTAMTPAELLLSLGEVQLANNTSAYAPETPVTVTLSSDISPIQWDEATSAYYYTYEDEDYEVWLIDPATIAYRMETAVKHNLRGVAFTTPIPPLDAAAATEPSLVWTISDDEGNVVATESGTEPTFIWHSSPDLGEFELHVEFVSGNTTTPLGALSITITNPEEVAAGNDDKVTTIGTVRQSANVRSGPGESYAKFPFPIRLETEFEIIGRDEFGYWYYIIYPHDDKETGWIAASLVNIDPDFDIDTLEDTTYTVADAPDNVVAAAPQPEPTTTDPAADSAEETPAEPPPAPSSPPPPISAPPVAVGGFELGGQTHSFSSPGLMAAAGMNWVKFQHKWGESDNPNDLAGRINSAHAAGFKVLLSIPGQNTYPESINFDAYVQFLAGVAALGPDAIEVWNEMNIDFEWPAGQIDPASYVNNMLAPAYNAIKGTNPNVMVISGAPAPTGFDNGTNAWADNRYMSGMLAAGGGNYADCIGAHYNAGATSPSLASGHPAGGHYSWYLLPTLNVYAQLGKPVCFTELGYLSGEDYGGVPERFSWAANTTVGQHAAWLAEAVSVAANTGKVRLIIVFNVDFTHWSDDPQAGYAMVRKDGGCPACETLARVMGR